MSMTNHDMIAKHSRVLARYEASCKEVDAHFTPQVKTALAKGDFVYARLIAAEIPDHVIKMFAYEFVRVAEAARAAKSAAPII